MFRRDVQQVKDLILRSLREQGLEMPLQQKRLVEAWPIVAGPVVARYTLNTYIYNQTLYVAGPVVARYTLNTYIYNQTLFVRLSNPALRSDLSMRRKELTEQLNKYVGNQVITDIRFG